MIIKQKSFIIAVLTIAIAGCIFFVACNKEDSKSINGSRPSSKESEPNAVLVGYLDDKTNEVVLNINKHAFLDDLQSEFTMNGFKYISEDIQIEIDTTRGCRTAVLSVSFFDLVAEAGNTLFIQSIMDTIHGGQIVYKVAGNSRHIICSGSCDNPCRAMKDEHGNIIMCQPCTDPMPPFAFGDIDGRNKWQAEHYCLASSVGGTSTTSNFQIVIRLLAANQLIL